MLGTTDKLSSIGGGVVLMSCYVIIELNIAQIAPLRYSDHHQQNKNSHQ